MPFQLYVKPEPRTLLLLSESAGLLFTKPEDVNPTAGSTGPSSVNKPPVPTAIVELLTPDQIDLNGWHKINRARNIIGVAGLLSVPIESSRNFEIFLVLVSGSVSLPPIFPNSDLSPSKILNIEFHCLISSLWDDPTLVPTSSSRNGSNLELDDLSSDMYISSGNEERGFASSSSSQTQAQQLGQIVHPCDGIKRYVESGTFYYANGGKWDISKRFSEWDWASVKSGKSSPGDSLEDFDERFVWNANLLEPLLHFRKHLLPAQRLLLDEENMIISLIQGFIGVIPVQNSGTLGLGNQATVGLISRLSWKRAGARFRTRGIDDEGNVANFVETETIFASEDICMSYVQIRGSVPLFWEQQGIQALMQKLQITRLQVASQPAFDKHFMDLLTHYHTVHAVNLLGTKDNESMLSLAYSDHLVDLSSRLPEDEDGRPPVSMTAYDFHAAVRVGGYEVVTEDFGSKLKSVRKAMEDFGWTTVDRRRGEVVERQRGVFRTNCLDCLDRTNFVQDVISTLTLNNFLASVQLSAWTRTINNSMRGIWGDQGDSLSRIYAGTGALNTSVTRSGKRTLGSFLSDTTKSLGRAYTNTFLDGDKQNSIDLLLGLMSGQQAVRVLDPISDSILLALSKRLDEYSQPKTLRLYTGTWNLNGRPTTESLQPWLFPEGEEQCDIYAISFQELVALTAQQIVQTDPKQLRYCEIALARAFEEHANGSYVKLRSEQLVGTAIVIFVKDSLIKSISRVETATFKTGLRGMGGNKGGVGIRFDLMSSSFCFMTCHLAAGHTAVNERNADYQTIANGLSFLRGKKIDEHDIIIWAADFNYRIDLDNSEARVLSAANELQPLWEADQLRYAMLHKDAFPGYNEGRIEFRPTYKFDVGTDTYDTSEKARIPAWTDRVLYRSSILEQKSYNRAELYGSDHRPVYATFSANVRVVDEAARAKIAKGLSDQIMASVAGGGAEGGLQKGLKELSVGHGGSGSKGSVVGMRQKPPPRPERPSPMEVKPNTPSSTGTSVTDDFVLLPNTASRRLPPPSRRLDSITTSSGAGKPPSRSPSLSSWGIDAKPSPTDSLGPSLIPVPLQRDMGGVGPPRRLPPRPVAALSSSDGAGKPSSPVQRSLGSPARETTKSTESTKATPPIIPPRPKMDTKTTSTTSVTKVKPPVPPKPKELGAM